VRAGLAIWRTACRAGIGRVSLDGESLVAAARRTTGLRDFVDESFREPMQRMLTALEDEACLHPLGRATMRESLVRALVNRLRLEIPSFTRRLIFGVTPDIPPNGSTNPNVKLSIKMIITLGLATEISGGEIFPPGKRFLLYANVFILSKYLSEYLSRSTL
jgi:hypothetical protein